MTHLYYLSDVFTDHAFGGNQLAVFPEGDKVPESSMQKDMPKDGSGRTTVGGRTPVGRGGVDQETRNPGPGRAAESPCLGPWNQARAARRRVSSVLGGAPTTVSTTWPSLKKRSVGMAWTP